MQKKYRLYFNNSAVDSNGFYEALYVGNAEGNIDTGVNVISHSTGGFGNLTGYLYPQKSAIFSLLLNDKVFISTDGNRMTFQNKIGSNPLSFMRAFIEFILQEEISNIEGDEYEGMNGKKAFLVRFEDSKHQIRKATMTNSWDSFWDGVGHAIAAPFEAAHDDPSAKNITLAALSAIGDAALLGATVASGGALAGVDVGAMVGLGAGDAAAAATDAGVTDTAAFDADTTAVDTDAVENPYTPFENRMLDLSEERNYDPAVMTRRFGMDAARIADREVNIPTIRPIETEIPTVRMPEVPDVPDVPGTDFPAAAR